MTMSRALFALPAACLLVVPASASAQPRQSPGVPTASPVSASIDQSLVGEWELAEVERLGAIDDFGAAVDEMNVEFGVDGQAHILLEIEQDQDTMARERTFRFTTLDGRIVPDQGAPVSYEIIGQDDIRLLTPDGLVVHLHRTASAEFAAE
jgi:hypothetical protein